MQKKQTIVRKDGIIYQRKCKDLMDLTRTISFRVSEDTYIKLKKKRNYCGIIRNLIEEYLKEN